MLEKDLDVYDVWESVNGNIFIKVSSNYSIAIGPKGFHYPNDYDLTTTQYVKSNDLTKVKKVGKLKFKKKNSE
jgi:hypothetical protein